MIILQFFLYIVKSTKKDYKKYLSLIMFRIKQSAFVSNYFKNKVDKLLRSKL